MEKNVPRRIVRRMNAPTNPGWMPQALRNFFFRILRHGNRRFCAARSTERAPPDPTHEIRCAD